MTVVLSAMATIGVMLHLAQRNLKEMSDRIREHNRTSVESFERIEKALMRVEAVLSRLVQ